MNVKFRYVGGDIKVEKDWMRVRREEKRIRVEEGREEWREGEREEGGWGEREG